MNSYADNVTANLEISRNSLRRIARNDDTECSNQSVLHLMEKFVKSMNTMEETILVPRRLMDVKVGDEYVAQPETNSTSQSNTHKLSSAGRTTANVPERFAQVDLFHVYNMLHSVKADLLWGVPNAAVGPAGGKVHLKTTTVPGDAPKGHVRRPSSISVASTNSASSTISDSESDAGNENDSGIEEANTTSLTSDSSSAEDDTSGGYRTTEAADEFRTHLYGLTHSLRQMTETAQYLTSRYQHEIGGAV